MGIKIINLPSSTTVNQVDYIPVSQNIGGSRQTYKMTFAQLSGFMLANTNKAIRDLTTRSGNTFIHLSGDEMTGGYLTLYNNPINPYHAATKNYIDVEIHDLREEINDPSNGFVHLNGDKMVGELELFGNPTKPMGATPKSYVDTQISNLRTSTSNGFVKLSGDTMTGQLTMNAPLQLQGNPSNPLEATTKSYVDAQVSTLRTSTGTGFVRLSGDKMSGLLQLSGPPSKPLEAATKSYVDFEVNSLRTSTSNGFVHLSGDIMTGALDLNSNELRRFSAKIVDKGADFTLSNDMNGSVILVDSSSQVTFTFAQNTLTKGFNAVILQMGDGNAKISTSGSVSIVNVNNGVKTRKKYAQMNLCVVRPNVMWIAGDII